MGLIHSLWDVFAYIGLALVLLFTLTCIGLFVWMVTQTLCELVCATIQIIRAQRFSKAANLKPAYKGFVDFVKSVWWVAVTTSGKGTLTINGWVIPRNPFRPIGWQPEQVRDEEED